VVDVAEQLPDTVEALRVLLLRRNDELEERNAEIAQLREYVRLLRHQRFGRKSEKVSPDQLSIFNEAEREVAEAASREEDQDEIQVPAHTRKKGGRRPLPAHFADGERLFRSIVIGRFGDRERSGATPVSLFL